MTKSVPTPRPVLHALTLVVASGLALLLGPLPYLRAQTPPAAQTCPKGQPPPAITRSQVYEKVPFKSGERSVYEVTWGGIKAGEASLEVRSPRLHNGVWHRVFRMDAKTGDWFKAIFVARDAAEAVSRPWDFGISQFYMEQDEGKMIGKRFRQKKWLEFNHEDCHVHERISEPDVPEKKATFELIPGANDSLGVVFNLRTQKYYLGQKTRLLVYTSEKNWWLDAEPVSFETLTTPAGTFKTVKLKLQTYIGKDLQQKGDVWAWLDIDSPHKPLVQIQGEIKIGSVWIKLIEFKPGAS